MSEESVRAEWAEAEAEYHEQMLLIARVQEQRVQLTASGTAAGKRVTVTVNADGVVIDVRFRADIGELDFDAIADAVTTAARKALAEVNRRNAALMDPVRAQWATEPGLVGLVDGRVDPESQIPVTLPATMTVPPPRAADIEDDRMEFTDVEEIPARKRGVTDPSW